MKGFVHIKSECTIFLSKQKRELLIPWYDSDDESEGEITNSVMAFTVKYDSYSESSDEDILEEGIDETYRLQLTQWKEYFLREDKRKKTISFGR